MKNKEKFKSCFNCNKPLIGMIHVQALPGTPKNIMSMNEIVNTAITEAQVYLNAGIDAIMIENMHDIPYLKKNVGPEIVSAMSIVGYEVKNKTHLPVGIQILAGANKEAIAAAKSAGLDFIRSEGFVYAHVADEGIFESDAGELLRYRKNIGAENILIFTDIKKKHSSHSITNDTSILETAKAAEFFMSDGVIITGKSTGESSNVDDVKIVNKKSNLPVLVGSGITAENLSDYFSLADGFIVGSYFKQNGNWSNPIDEKRIAALIKIKQNFSSH